MAETTVSIRTSVLFAGIKIAAVWFAIGAAVHALGCSDSRAHTEESAPRHESFPPQVESGGRSVARLSEAERSPATLAAEDRAFDELWRDGLAEIASYDIVYPRYGQPRQGTGVAITVHEGGLDARTFVKVESRRPDRSRGYVPAIKLNWIVDFATGIYDYHLMTSAFVATADADGHRKRGPLKVSFGSQEWCGHVYAQALFDASALRLASHSYFEGEADKTQSLEMQAGGFSEDMLALWARGLAGPAGVGESPVAVPLLRSLAWARLNHTDVVWDHARLQRVPEPQSVVVPAGTFEVDRFLAVIEAQAEAPTRSWTFDVEREGYRRVIRIERSDGMRAQLIASKRLAYWELNGVGGAGTSHLRSLGL
ncbi:MAG: hypothetical protein AAF355_01985 [Myxococcota bacterium]